MKSNSHCFKVGDVVVKNNYPIARFEKVTVGKEYKIVAVGTNWIQFKDDNGRSDVLESYHFEQNKRYIVNQILSEL
jgi:hypothetical protein